MKSRCRRRPSPPLGRCVARMFHVEHLAIAQAWTKARWLTWRVHWTRNLPRSSIPTERCPNVPRGTLEEWACRTKGRSCERGPHSHLALSRLTTSPALARTFHVEHLTRPGRNLGTAKARPFLRDRGHRHASGRASSRMFHVERSCPDRERREPLATAIKHPDRPGSGLSAGKQQSVPRGTLLDPSQSETAGPLLLSRSADRSGLSFSHKEEAPQRIRHCDRLVPFPRGNLSNLGQLLGSNPQHHGFGCDLL